ncbi:UNVERIFIED_ORG: hypothetical protein J3D59_002695 [Pseudomonas fluorescens]
MNSPNTSHNKSFSNIRTIGSSLCTALKWLYIVGGLLITTAVYSDESSEITGKPPATTNFDARFPNTNQSKHCWQSYVDYYKCIQANGEDFSPCTQFKKDYTSWCPKEWVIRWDEQLENGTSPISPAP